MHDIRQLSLFHAFTEDALLEYLSKKIGKTIRLVITDNTVSMISVTPDREKPTLRLHRMFLSAPDDVLRDLARFIGNRKHPTPLISDFIKENRHLIGTRKPSRKTLRTAGSHHDLAPVAASLNREYFGDRVTAPVTWGQQRRRRCGRMITLGSYYPGENIIRINPALDRKRVPAYFLAFIVYHEMLHADLGIPEQEGRRVVHCREFKRRERLFRDYARARAWENWHYRG